MDLRKGRCRAGLVALLLMKSVVCLFCVSLCLQTSASDFVFGISKEAGTSGGRRNPSGGRRPGFLIQGGERRTLAAAAVSRRRLIGPGSYPPRCATRCGRCSPCRPVHVPVPPGIAMPAEYYPEAWRCKCGNRLYMP